MSHTTETEGCFFIHDGDFDGKVRIAKKKTEEYIEVEFDDLLAFFAQYLRREKVKEIENTPWRQLIKKFVARF